MTRSAAALALFLSATAALAQEPSDCRIPPSRLDATATLLLRDFASSDSSLPDRLVIGNSVRAASPEGGRPAGVRAVHEAFYRPLEDATYALLPLPIFGVKVTRSRHVLYACARADTGAGTRELTVYVMRGHHLDPSSLGTIFGDIFNDAEIKVAPVPVSPIDLAQLNESFLGIFRRIPLIGDLLKLPGIPIRMVQAIADRLTADFIGLGVERIVLTEKYIELAVGVDLSDPSRARKIRRIDLREAQAADLAAKAARGRPGLDGIVYDPSTGGEGPARTNGRAGD